MRPATEVASDERSLVIAPSHYEYLRMPPWRCASRSAAKRARPTLACCDTYHPAPSSRPSTFSVSTSSVNFRAFRRSRSCDREAQFK